MARASGVQRSPLLRMWRVVHWAAYRLWWGLLAARLALLIALLCLLALDAAIGHAAQPVKPPMDPKTRAYTLVLICYVVGLNDHKEADSQRASDAANKMGKTLGLSDKRVSDDRWNMISVVGDEYHKDPASMDRNRELCRKMGFVR